MNLFNKFVEENLKWNPWIGDEYDKTKLFVLGESDYEDGDFWKNNRDTTKIIIKKRVDNIKGKWILHRNVERTLTNRNDLSSNETSEIWNSVIYHNLVQRLLDSREKEDRPKHTDFDIGWELFFKLVEFVKPNYCLVLGKKSKGRLGYYLHNKQSKWLKTDSEFYGENQVISLVQEDWNLKLFFINHPSGSRGFKYSDWAVKINGIFPEVL